MKKLITLLLIALSSVSFAVSVSSSNTSNTNAIIAQKAIDSGVTFQSNQSQYQLILGGRAIIRSDNSLAAQLANSPSNKLWSSQKGPYQVSIGTSGSRSNSSLSSSGVSFNQIAYNPESGNIAIINGEIIVKLKANVSAEYIASIYEIILTNSFERIDTATYRVNSWQDIFTIAQQLNENAGVEFAELDVIEHFIQAN